MDIEKLVLAAWRWASFYYLYPSRRNTHSASATEMKKWYHIFERLVLALWCPTTSNNSTIIARKTDNVAGRFLILPFVSLIKLDSWRLYWLLFCVIFWPMCVCFKSKPHIRRRFWQWQFVRVCDWLVGFAADFYKSTRAFRARWCLSLHECCSLSLACEHG